MEQGLTNSVDIFSGSADNLFERLVLPDCTRYPGEPLASLVKGRASGPLLFVLHRIALLHRAGELQVGCCFSRPFPTTKLGAPGLGFETWETTNPNQSEPGM